jgi:hypothetical protein
MKFRRLVASLTAVLLVAGASSLAQAQEKKKERKLTKQEQQDAQTLLKLVDAGTPASDLPVVWEQHHFVKAADGKTFVPFTVKADTKSEVSLYVRAVAKNAAPPAKGMKVEYPWDDIQFLAPGPDGRFSRALSVAPGEYDVFVAIKEKSTGKEKKGEVNKTTLLKRDLSVPDFTQPDLKISSVILAENVEAAQPLDMDGQRANPYTFAGMKVTPSLEAKFKKAGELNLVFWIYGVAPTSMQKPDVQVEYSFSKKDGDGWKYFNKTAPQMLNGSTFPPEFSLAVGHLVTGSLSIPLGSFEATDYRLEIKITDKVSGKSVTENVQFNVGA